MIGDSSFNCLKICIYNCCSFNIIYYCKVSKLNSNCNDTKHFSLPLTFLVIYVSIRTCGKEAGNETARFPFNKEQIVIEFRKENYCLVRKSRKKPQQSKVEVALDEHGKQNARNK